MKKIKCLLVLFALLLLVNVDVFAIDNNMYLKILRLEFVGLEPAFSPEVNEYYYVVDDSVDNLNITAIPNDNDVNIKINGNENLVVGMNVITIMLEKKDAEEKNYYYIYVTKTNNKEIANSNLETLAVRQSTLIPEFNKNITNYNLEIDNDVYRLEILAIAENPNANIEINGNDDLEVGENIIEVRVIAEDNTSFKKYYLNVHRRSIEEDYIYKNNKKIQAERLSAILNSKATGKQETEDYFSVIIGIIAIIMSFFIGGLLYWLKRKIH